MYGKTNPLTPRFVLNKKKPQHDQQRRIRHTIEIVFVGVLVGLTVVALRVLTVPGSQGQWISLALAAVVITVLHFALRRSVRQRARASTVKMPPRPTRVQPEDLFANELDQSWTGLSDPDEAVETTSMRRNRDLE